MVVPSALVFVLLMTIAYAKSGTVDIAATKVYEFSTFHYPDTLIYNFRSKNDGFFDIFVSSAESPSKISNDNYESKCSFQNVKEKSYKCVLPKGDEDWHIYLINQEVSKTNSIEYTLDVSNPAIGWGIALSVLTVISCIALVFYYRRRFRYQPLKNPGLADEEEESRPSLDNPNYVPQVMESPAAVPALD